MKRGLVPAALLLAFSAEAQFPVEEYAQVEYLEADGKQVYYLGFTPTTTTVSQLKLRYIKYSGDIFYGCTGTGTGYRLFMAGGGTTYFDVYTTSNARICGTVFATGTDYEVEVGNYYVKNLATGSKWLSGSTFSTLGENNDMRFFTSGRDYGRVYWLRVCEGAELTHRIVPIRRRSDGFGCFYDLTTDTLITNSVSGDVAPTVGDAVTNVFFAAAIPTQYYDGYTALTPTPNCLDNADVTKVLDSDEYAILSYANNTHAGTGNMTIAGLGDYAAITNVTFFTIENKTEDDLLAVLPIPEYLIDGHAAAEPTLVVSNKTTHALLASGDFAVRFEDNTQAGEGKAYITGKGDYAGHALYTTFIIYSQTKRWLGTTSALASEAANWLGGKVPVEGDSVVVDEQAADNPMTWDLPIASLNGWTQTNYAGTVTFKLGPDYGGGGIMRDGAPWLVFTGDVAVWSGTWTYPYPSSTTLANETYKLNIDTAGTLTVGPEAVFDLDGCGFPVNAGPGAANNTITAHGGFGFMQRTNGYGSVRWPVDYGMGGMSGRGGGAARFKVAGAMTVDGTIRARGLPITAGNTGATGAGGSILIEAADLVGAGTLSVKGGCEARANCGAGGRMAVHLSSATDFDRWTGTLNAEQGTGGSCGDDRGWGSQHSGPGTIYLRAAGEAVDEGTLIIRSGVNKPRTSASIAQADEWTVGTLVIDGGYGRFWIPDGCVLTIKRDIKLRNGTLWQGSDIIDYGTWVGIGGDKPHYTAPSGTVKFDNSVTNVHVVEGVQHLEKWVVDDPATVLRFGTTSDDAFTVTSGKFTVTGDPDKSVTLEPEDLESTWTLTAADDATVDVTYAALLKSVASRPLTAFASEDLGGNVNWSFAELIVFGTTNTWTGAANTDWSDGANWSLARAPVASDVAVVEAHENEPTLAGVTVDCYKLLVKSGATLTLGGVDLVVSNLLDVAGRIVATGTESISLYGDANWCASGFSSAASTVALVGGGEQNLALGGNVFHAVRVEKTGGTASFAESFAATSVVARTSGAVALRFAGGSRVTAYRMFFDGGTDGLSLRPVSDGTWRFKVLKSAHFLNVLVTGSDATDGVTCQASAGSTGVGENPGWDFSPAFAAWNGSSSTAWDTAANWTPAAVPSEASDVLVLADGGALTLVASGAISVKSLTLDGEGGTVSLTANGKVTLAGDLNVADGATAVLNGYDDNKTTIGGNVVVSKGGTLTHSYNGTTEQYKLDLDVAGSVTVAEGGAIDLYGKGYAVGYTAYGTAYNGWSFAATVANVNAGKPTSYDVAGVAAKRPTYGSAFDTFKIGPGYAHAGGGAVRIVSGGEVRVDGTVAANGAYSIYDGYSGGSGCGGSVVIRAPSLSGSGVVCADSITPHSFNDGSGGRVSVHVAKGGLDGFTGRLSAWSHGSGGGVNYCWTMCMCGTVYTDVGGVEELILDQGASYGILNQAGYVVLPADLDGDDPARFANVKLILRNKVRLVLSQDMAVRDLQIEQKALTDWAKDGSYPTPIVPTLDVYGHVLTIVDYDHRNGRGWGDTIPRLVFDTSSAQSGDLVWKPRGTFMCVR